MNVEHDHSSVTTRITREVRKWNNDRTPEDGPPDEILRRTFWLDENGLEITDPDRIALLEQKHRMEVR